MLEINNITKKFRKKRALEDFRVTLDHGIYGILGANGAGKTTLIRCLMGLYQPNQGDILWKGKSIRKNSTYTESIGYLPQKFEGLKGLKVKECLEYFGDLKNIEKNLLQIRIGELLELVNLKDKENAKVGSLSGGMMRRLGIAQALLNDPELLVFDEPTAGLDPGERLRFKNIIANLSKDKIVMISTHIVEDIEALCDSILVMKQGKLLGKYQRKELADAAVGKVFEIPEDQIFSLKSKYKVIREYQSRDQRMLRVLSDEIKDIQPVEPTIEDGYICLTTEKIS